LDPNGPERRKVAVFIARTRVTDSKASFAHTACPDGPVLLPHVSNDGSYLGRARGYRQNASGEDSCPPIQRGTHPGNDIRVLKKLHRI
jgi:hypothetical protein